ncbi:hypothetical protein [Methylobacterium oryzihabitans]|uniref:Uncharacterized protein n=1 Tax=Methylobacterium oryzihabitans TaxID=2499852 RepID=A0A3S2VDB6_9HYPH|nr:hypothetical protein [Methylobacterium oryzihabitans]RVU20170.1 hypothetical protein EOE48_06060 [Methylobacterium oryzihabitans]
MTDWNDPARLVSWPNDDATGDEPETVTLREAVLAARRLSDRRTAWIITANGHILRPGEIEALVAELPPDV